MNGLTYTAVAMLTGELKLTPLNWRVIRKAYRVGGMPLRTEFYVGDIVLIGPFTTQSEAYVCLNDAVRVAQC